MTPLRSRRSIRLCTVVRDSCSRRAISAVGMRASSRSSESRASSAGLGFMRGFYRRSAENFMVSAQIAPTNRRRSPDNRRIDRPRPARRRQENRMTANPIAALAPLRARKGQRRTAGLDDATVARFAAGHPDLVAAIEAAAAEFARVEGDFADLLDLDEDAQVQAVQAGFVNFYPQDGVNPYVALAARGPWIV